MLLNDKRALDIMEQTVKLKNGLYKLYHGKPILPASKTSPKPAAKVTSKRTSGDRKV